MLELLLRRYMDREVIYDLTQCALAILGIGAIAVLSLTGKPIPTELTWFAAAIVGSYFKASPTTVSSKSGPVLKGEQ